MDFDSLTFDQKIAVHELEIGALRNEIDCLDELVVALIDLLSKPSGSSEFAHELKMIQAQRDAIRQRRAARGGR